MRRYQGLTIGLIISLVIFLVIGAIWNETLLINLLSYLPAFILSAITGLILWGLKENIEKTLGKEQTKENDVKPYTYNPNLKHLSIHYVEARNSDTLESATEKLLVDTSMGKAYGLPCLPDWLLPAIKNHELYIRSYTDTKCFDDFIKPHYDISNAMVTPETVGLQYVDNQYRKIEPYANILSKLKGHTLENLLVIKLKRRQLFWTKRRNILIDFKNEKVWFAPDYWYLLKEKGILQSDERTMRFYDSCRSYCIREYKFELVPNYYPESMLLEQSLTNPPSSC
jgi:hypothetical protein